MKIENIRANETITQKSAYDPYCPTLSGKITFRVKKRVVTIKTINGFAESIEAGGDEFELYGESRIKVSDFVQEIWTLEEANIELPREIELLV